MIEVPVACAKNVGSASDGGSNDMVVIRIVRPDWKKILLPRLDARGGGLQGRYDALDLPVIESMHTVQARVEFRLYSHRKNMPARCCAA